MDKTSGGTPTRYVTYYPAAGAMRISIVGGSNTLYYILKDHLGSASVVTDSTGAVVGEQRYCEAPLWGYPYGETRLTTGTIYTDKLFTGQREMAGLGIYHYGARFYSPKVGRFLSPDTIVPGAANPQAWNRYSYILGNPLRYTDPTGHMVACNPMEDDCHHALALRLIILLPSVIPMTMRIPHEIQILIIFQCRLFARVLSAIRISPCQSSPSLLLRILLDVLQSLHSALLFLELE